MARKVDAENNEVDPFEQFYMYGNPNADRVGCPGSEVIRGLATRELPIDHPAREHLGKCSPCFREFKSVVAQTRRINERRRRRPLLVAMAAAALVLIGLAGFEAIRSGLIGGRHVPLDGQKQTTTQGAPQSRPQAAPHSFTTIVALDFRQAGVERGAGPAPSRPSWRIPQAIVSLEITLPFASDDGVYSVEIRGLQDGSVVKAGSGIAKLLDGETRLTVPRLDLSDVRPGKYSFAFRHADAHWSRAVVSVVEERP
jgi:hypothetical protein